MPDFSSSADTLASIAVEIFADDGPLRSGLDAAVSYSRGRGEQVGSAFASGFHSPIVDAVGTVRQLQYGLSDTLDVASKLSGVDIAARYERLQIAFQSITGSGEQARKIMQDLAQIGAETPFQTEQLTGYAQQLLSLGVSAKQVTKDIQALADATAARGGTTESLGSLTSILAGFRVRPRLDIREVAELGRYLDLAKVVGAGTGKNITSPVQAEQILSGMSGSNAYDTIIRGIQKTYAGAASGQGGNTLLGLGQNLQESAQLALKPTGDLLLPILEGLAKGGVWAASELGKLNEVTGGSAGLAVMAGTAYFGIRRFGGGVVDTIRGVSTLTTSLMRLAETMATTKAATDSETVAEERNAVAKTGNAGRGGGLGTGIESFALFFTQSGDSFNRGFNRLEQILGVSKRFRVGTDDATGPGAGGSEASKNTAALADNTAALKAASKAIGGGGRTGAAASQIEREYAVYALTRGAQTGIG